MRAARLHPDAVLWNALITAAGRAGQLQRAFQTLEEMQVQFCLWFGSNQPATLSSPNNWKTYASRPGHTSHNVEELQTVILCSGTLPMERMAVGVVASIV